MFSFSANFYYFKNFENFIYYADCVNFNLIQF